MAQVNTFYLISVLKRYSDSLHPLSVSQIKDYIEKDFFIDHPEACPHHTTISRALDDLMENYCDASYAQINPSIDLIDPLNVGFQIVCVIKRQNGDFKVFDKNSDFEKDSSGKKKKSPTCYYYYQGLFEPSETLLLITFLEANHLFSAEDTRRLVSKLSTLNPKALPFYENKTNYASDSRLDDKIAYTLEHIKTIQEAINNGEFLRIVNGVYDMTHNLVPRYKETDSAYELIARPVRITSGNGHYYLIAVIFLKYTEEYVTIHYRIDRLITVEPFTPTSEQKANYKYTDPGDAAAYLMQHPDMFVGEPVQVTMSVVNSIEMLNVLMDFFGKESKITKDPNDPTRLIVRVNASKDGLKRFLKEYCDRIYLTWPKDFAREIQKEISAGLAYYHYLDD